MNEFLLIGVVLTFIGTVINIFYTRINLKTSKYIDTITSERIKWLDVIRNEVTNIVVNVHFTLRIYSDNIQERESEMNNNEDDYEDQGEAQSRYFDTETSSALGQRKERWSQSDFIKYLYILKLRLNYVEDKQIIEIIDYFIKFYAESPFKSANEIPYAREKICLLVVHTQKLLKQEWEKVKCESRGIRSKRR